MSTLAMSKKKSFSPVRIYLLLSILCVLVDKGYGLFSHGVSSSAMSLMFLYPLLGGGLMSSIFSRLLSHPSSPALLRVGNNAIGSGVATLTLSAFLTGIIEIAGSSSAYILAFQIVGWTLEGVGLAVFLLMILQSKKGE